MSHVKKTMSLLAAAGLSVMMAVSAVSADLNQELADRLKPVGEVCMSGESCAAAPVAAAPAAPRTGAEVYDAYCNICHTAGVSGAPKIGSADDWAPRLDKGMETLYAHAWNGFNAMPAKGMCMNCSEEEIHHAVDHMIDSAK